MNRLNLHLIIFFVIAVTFLYADNGRHLWLKYDLLQNDEIREQYIKSINGYTLAGKSETMDVIENELQQSLSTLLGRETTKKEKANLVIGSFFNFGEPLKNALNGKTNLPDNESFLIRTVKLKDKTHTIITANSDVGALYGTFHFLRLLQTQQSIKELNIISSPKIQLRVLNHWDNPDRTVERGYAGSSIWDWHRLPKLKQQYYYDYARANASVGINGTAINNVNANPIMLTPQYLEKVKSLADIFRPFGIKIYLSIKFSAPIDIGGLKVSDPLDENVRKWWKDKTDEIYKLIPNFGGYLVKANSEGQPGPQDYNRTHADGANMLANALKPYGGVVMWRAFVYAANSNTDRAKEAYQEFKPLDGAFRDNVLIQVKNGPIDFQPREPFSPLFGAMPKTPLMMEFQITMEYLGQGTHFVYLGPMYEEVLDSDTFVKGEGSTVAKVIDGSLDKRPLSGIAGVANIGTDPNWTGHLFGQSNWYVYGRLAWDHQLSSKQIAEEWTRMTLSNNEQVVNTIVGLMMESRENTVNYMTPLGLHHIMGEGHHYGPGPWVAGLPREEWTSVYYHKADEKGIGFDRTESGSNALQQYHLKVQKIFKDPHTCPDEFLLWFHHLSWDFKMKSGKTLWDELVNHYYTGAQAVKNMQKTWDSLQGKIEKEQFTHVKMMLSIQYDEAVWWRNACLLYFRTFSQKPIPEHYEQPDKTLEYYKNLQFRYTPNRVDR
jgi:alpha-glucuronidase